MLQIITCIDCGNPMYASEGQESKDGSLLCYDCKYREMRETMAKQTQKLMDYILDSLKDIKGMLV